VKAETAYLFLLFLMAGETEVLLISDKKTGYPCSMGGMAGETICFC
jgi:hypothetical protein